MQDFSDALLKDPGTVSKKRDIQKNCSCDKAHRFSAS